MEKYAIIVDKATGLVNVGMGDYSKKFDDKTTLGTWYKSQGMTLMNVEKGYDGSWYLADKVPAKPAPTTEEILKGYEDAVQAHLDATAQSRGYDNTYTCLSYIASTDEIWHRESNAFNAWRDRVWRKCHEIMNSVLAGATPQPTVEELIAQLPVIDWGE